MEKKNLIIMLVIGLTLAGYADPAPDYEILERIPVAPVWSATSVGFALQTAGNRQFVVFYDADRQMTAGQRELDSKEWTFQKLPNFFIGWDSHNYITMAIDDDGYLHVSGNMHVAPLVYFRSDKPYDVTSLRPVNSMTGEKELKCTYPKFLCGPNGELIFSYRDGSSGKGDQIYNVYDLKTKTWRRLIDSPLTDGEGLMNAYFQGPTLGPDGWFHMTWVWRDTIDCETNHDLCYARSKDLIHWETAEGQPIELPIRLDTPGVLVDPVPIRQGMLNGNGKIGFDTKNRVILSYHKFDANGNTQLYNARLENGKWTFYQTSDWNYRWYFSGGGSINNDIQISPIVVENGELRQPFSHKEEGSKILVLDETALRPVRTVASVQWPQEIKTVRSAFPGMLVKVQKDNKPQTGNAEYILRWETLPAFRDAPRPEPWPEPSLLEVYKVKQWNSQ
jgi:hypothetical protein